MAPSRDPSRLDWSGSTVPFLLVHLAAAAAPFVAPPTGGLAALAGGLYLVRMFGITAGFHRYFAHRAYRTGRAFQLVLAVLGTLASQKGPLWWAAHHRGHHRFSDTEEDLHSPLRHGFLWAHLGWFLSRGAAEAPLDRVKDLTRYPELRWLDRHWVVPPVLLGVGLFLAGGLPAFLWGFCVSTVALWHATFGINSLAHLLGTRRYETGDDSRNNALLALLTLGEGWHNNHHFHASSASQGWFWWELDLSYAALRLLGAVGLVSRLRTPPAQVRLAHRLAPRARPSSLSEASQRPGPRGDGSSRAA